jgi:hypothetical protein
MDKKLSLIFNPLKFNCASSNEVLSRLIVEVFALSLVIFSIFAIMEPGTASFSRSFAFNSFFKAIFWEEAVVAVVPSVERAEAVRRREARVAVWKIMTCLFCCDSSSRTDTDLEETNSFQP